MLKLAIGRIVSAAFTAGGWLFAGARLVLDLIGYSTVPEDVEVAQSRVDQLVGYLLVVPWWAALGFALIATLWLMHVSWPRESRPAAPGDERRLGQEVAPDRRHTSPRSVASSSTSPPPPVAAPSVVHVNLLQALQAFFKIQLWDACQHLRGAIGSVLHNAQLKRPGQLGALPYFKREALESGMAAIVEQSRANLDAAVAEDSLDDAQKAINACLDSYQRTQQYIGELAAHLEVDLDANEAVADWLRADNACLLRFRELTSSPELQKLRRVTEGWQAAATHSRWREPTFMRSTFSGTSPRFPWGLYVGAMHVDVQHLGQEFYFDIAIHGFNATGETISISDVQGVIGYREVIDDERAEKVDLPSAAILPDDGVGRVFEDLRPLHVVLRQQVRRATAERASALLAEGQQVELEFDGLHVIAAVTNAPHRTARLPLWNGAMLGKHPDRTLTASIAAVSVEIGLGSGVDVN